MMERIVRLILSNLFKMISNILRSEKNEGEYSKHTKSIALQDVGLTDDEKEKYAHLLRKDKGKEFDGSIISSDLVQRILHKLRGLGVVIRQNTGKIDGTVTRVALTYILPKRPPIIFIIKLDDDKDELSDTIFHEAIHATAPILDRYDRSPEIGSEEYQLEEICAHAGTAKIWRTAGAKYNQRALSNIEKYREIAIADEHKLSDAQVERSISDGVKAADLLLS